MIFDPYLTGEYVHDGVTAADGRIYDRRALSAYLGSLAANKLPYLSPATRLPMSSEVVRWLEKALVAQ
jgi:hypothetical protein